MKQKIISLIAFALIRLLGLTYRHKFVFSNSNDREIFYELLNSTKSKKKNFLLGCFHQDELCLINYFSNRDMAGLISVSKDGEIMARVLHLLGYRTVRGSSSKKAVSGLIACIKLAKSGYSMAFAVDGPRGPIFKVKDGICAVSNKTNTPIIPCRAYPSRYKTFEKSWNKARLVKPFALIEIRIGKIGFYTSEELEKTLQNL